VGISQALEWVYTGEIFEAHKAKESGFVRSVHATEDLMAAAYTHARSIAQKFQVGITLARQMILRLSATDNPRKAHNIDILGDILC
jgi:enoyl-CoA hydratase/carnithine racemase